MTVLVTGSTGFLGTVVVERLLARGVTTIRCLARPSSNAAPLDALASGPYAGRLQVTIGNLQSARDAEHAVAGADTICHLAAAMRGSPASVFVDTVVATRRLLDAAASSAVKRLVLVSSLSVYGLADVPADRLIDEGVGLEGHPERRDVYSHAKLRQELLVHEHAARAGLEVVILRPATLYGCGRPLLPARVGLAAGGWLIQFGGTHILPLSHVSNCAEAVALAGTGVLPAGAYNVVDDDLPTVAEYVRRYKRDVGPLRSIRWPFFATMLLSHGAERLHVSSKGRFPRVMTPYRTATLWRGHRFDNRKLRQAGWRQVISTRDGLAHSFDDWAVRHRVASRFVAHDPRCCCSAATGGWIEAPGRP